MAKKTLEKNSILLYFETFKEKFFKIVLLNIIYFCVLSVLLIASFGLAYLLFDVLGLSNLLAPIATLPLILMAPLTAAVMRILCDFVRGEPGFFAEDFKRALKINFKQSIVIGIVQYVVVWLLYIAIRYYYAGTSYYQGGMYYFFLFGLGVSFFVALMLVFMSFYLYPMCVTLSLKLREIFKNAAIFSFLCLGKNLLLLIIVGAFVALMYQLVIYTIALKNALVWGLVIVIFMAFFFGFIFYTVAYFVFPSIKKYVLDPYYKEHPELTVEGSKKDKADAADIDYIGESDQKPESEYVYINGRLVHHSSLNEQAVFSDKSAASETEQNMNMSKEEIEHIKSKYKR